MHVLNYGSPCRKGVKLEVITGTQTELGKGAGQEWDYDVGEWKSGKGKGSG